MTTAAEEDFRLLVSSVKDYAIYRLDVDGRIATWNEGGFQIKGYRPHEIIGKHFSIFFTPEDVAAGRPEQLLLRAAAEERLEDEAWRVRKDGTRFWADVIITALRRPDGQLAGFAKVTRDLTSRKQLEDELRSSEERLSATLYSIGDAVLVTDGDGRIERLNRVAERLTGWPEKEAIGRPIDEVFVIINEDTRARAENPVLRVLAEGIITGLANHTTLVARDGREYPIADSGAPVRDASGAVSGAVLVFRDITEERRAADALERSEEKLRLLVANVHDYAIFMLDPSGFVTTWNPGAERIQGYSESEALGMHFSRFHPPEDVEAGKPERELLEATREGRFEDESWRVRKDGTRFWANVVIGAIRDPSGRVLGFTKVTRDLTERRRLEEDRMRLLQAHEAIRLRDEFLSIASHELKTPVTALHLQLEAMHEQLQTLDDRVAQRCRRAVQSADRLAELIDALLDVSRIATGRLELHPDRFGLDHAARDVVERYRDAATKAGCALTLETQGRVIGRWDRLRVEQVLANLLSNAMKHCSNKPIEVFVGCDERGAILRVRDHGPGISPEDLDRIFGRFERAASIRHYGGLGLGLYLARQIAEAHHGQITASNGEDGGACFTLILPLEEASETTTESARAPIPEKHSVLVVDDDRDIRETLVDALQDAGYHVAAAENGAEALQRLAIDPLPSVILLDLMMPVMDGFEFRRVQKLDLRIATIPVIAITAGSRTKPKEIDVDDYVAKPLRLSTLLTAVERYCAQAVADRSA